MIRGEATNNNFSVFVLTRPGLEPTIYRTRGEYANHYATDAVRSIEEGHTTQWPKETGQTLIHKTLHRKLKIEQHELN